MTRTNYTTTTEILKHNPHYKQIHEFGFVGLLETMGTDLSVSDAARLSYGVGTRSISDDESLIRYLMRHSHVSPFQMPEIKFHIRLPIFVMRQLIRHNADVNEYSARYSEVPDVWYTPTEWNLQSTTNKQGRAESVPEDLQLDIKCAYDSEVEGCFQAYKFMIDSGVSREQARMVLPVSSYTEVYWKQNIRDFMFMAKLRVDSHAQKEIRDFVEPMLQIAREKFPIIFKAFDDYILNAITFTAPEIQELVTMLNIDGIDRIKLKGREKQEFLDKINNTLYDTEI